MIRNLIFDWSGTLIDDFSCVLKTTNALFRYFRRPEMSLPEFRTKFRLPFAEFYAEQLPEVSEEKRESLYEQFFQKFEDGICLLPGAREILSFCKATGRRRYLLSTIQTASFETQVARLGIRDFFEHAETRVLDKREKIQEMLSIHNLNPVETAFVGDMVHDIETARRGGIWAVAVLTGFDPPEKLLSATPDLVVRNLEVLHAFL